MKKIKIKNYEISKNSIPFIIAENFRGKGFGSRLLELGCKEAQKIWTEIKIIKAEVLAENIASHRAF